MRTIRYSTAFRRDYRRIKANPRHRHMDDLLPPLLELLANRPPIANIEP